jgi:hypothetical protein
VALLGKSLRKDFGGHAALLRKSLRKQVGSLPVQRFRSCLFSPRIVGGLSIGNSFGTSSTTSVRLYVRLGSSLSSCGRIYSRGDLSMNNWASLGATMSVRATSRLGSDASVTADFRFSGQIFQFLVPRYLGRFYPFVLSRDAVARQKFSNRRRSEAVS